MAGCLVVGFPSLWHRSYFLWNSIDILSKVFGSKSCEKKPEICKEEETNMWCHIPRVQRLYITCFSTLLFSIVESSLLERERERERERGRERETEGVGYMYFQSKKDSKDQESIQSSATPVPGYQMGK